MGIGTVLRPFFKKRSPSCCYCHRQRPNLDECCESCVFGVYELLCRFHIDKNVKAKCKSLIGQKNVWDYVMDSWGNLVDCPLEQEFPEHLQRFQVACSPWPMFVDYVCETWIVPHKEKFILAWTNKVMHLGNTTTNRYLHVLLFFVKFV